jgi:hypothetical protein
MTISMILGITAFTTWLGASIFNIHEQKTIKELKIKKIEE